MNRQFENLFIIEEDGTLAINKPEVRAIKEFKAILVRSKGIKGDHEGRKKHYAFMELMFVHLYGSPMSTYKDLGKEDRIYAIKDNIGLPENWKPDNVIFDAVDKYVAMFNMSALHYSYNNASKAVYSIGKDIDFFNEQKNRVRKQLEQKMQIALGVGEVEQQEAQLEIEVLNNSLIKLGNEILSLTSKLDNAYLTLTSLKDKLLKEENEGAAVRGGGKLGNRESI